MAQDPIYQPAIVLRSSGFQKKALWVLSQRQIAPARWLRCECYFLGESGESVAHSPISSLHSSTSTVYPCSDWCWSAILVLLLRCSAPDRAYQARVSRASPGATYSEGCVGASVHASAAAHPGKRTGGGRRAREGGSLRTSRLERLCDSGFWKHEPGWLSHEAFSRPMLPLPQLGAGHGLPQIRYRNGCSATQG